MSAPVNESEAIDWDARELPDAWPDALSLRRLPELCRVAVRVFRGPHGRVTLPDSLLSAERIPRYALQEFHSLPNGNYSKHVTHGYSNGFDIAMLGVMRKRRLAIAEVLADCSCVLDIGCGAGHTAGTLLERRTAEVWGLDPSPYLLQHAARAYPNVRFVQGVAEEMKFPDGRFDGVCACFLFHELPPRVAERALTECHRVLRPGGRLVITEPGREQWQATAMQILWRHGWRGIYFRALAHFVYEPFLEAFHRSDLADLLGRSGFTKIRKESDFPTTQWTAVRP